MIRSLSFVHALCLAVLPAVTLPVHAADEPRDLAARPPRVLTAVAHMLAQPSTAANARVELTLAQDEVLPATFTLYLESGAAVFRDDGKNGDAQAADRVYSAYVLLDLAALRRNQDRIAQVQAARGPVTMALYDLRERIDRLPIPPEYFETPLPGKRVPIWRWGIAEAVQPDHSLLVRDPHVVDDPARTYDPCTDTGTRMGKWTFGFLMKQLANHRVTGIQPEALVHRWLDQLRNEQTINGFVVRPIRGLFDQVWTAWPKTATGELDLERAPFRLLAIVNRIDLRHNVLFGGRTGGEARLVFGFNRCDLPGPNHPPITVIFEYGIDRDGCPNLQAWARQWHALGRLALGSPDYNAALERITDQFTLAGRGPAKPNQSALNQLRTNAGFNTEFWEWREFRLPGKAGASSYLDQTTVRQTPDLRFNGSTTLRDYINANLAQILASEHVVPASFAGRPFLAGFADGFFGLGRPPWDTPGLLDPRARHHFALQACNGCHLRETGNVPVPADLMPFFHIRPAPPGVPASLSGFMTGITVTDWRDGATVREFNELERRAVDLDAVAYGWCMAEIDPIARTRPGPRRAPIPLNMSH